ncbi:MAG: FAD-dependent oxidoreductase [Polyangiaceae bacterium]|nr:FAD-dependent oxidoreductase [Polyangiaceae bacterium]
MLPDEVSVMLGLDEPDDPEHVRARVARALGVREAELPPLTVKKRSIDARRGRVRFRLLVGLEGEPEELSPELPREVSGPAEVVIVGDGPAGMFAAYELARRGVASVVLDRGKQVRPRRKDLRGLTQLGVVDPDSNYCFGEGGAGTYSDGKLYTRAHKRGNVRDVLEVLALHGAPPSILVDARPHIGSNRLPLVVTALRERLEGVGVRFRFEARVTELLLDQRRVAGVRLADGSEIPARQVVIATGHSARDVFMLLDRAGVELEAKAFAMGVRIEHPQPLINRIQYGAAAGHPKLPAAAYQLADHGVFSFCMCPGGFVVPASTEPEGLVVNGMSLSRRDSPFANSGLVVSVELEDLEGTGPLAGVELQRRLEQAALLAGGGRLRAPATRATDFVAGRGSSTVPKSSYVPGIVATDVAEVLGPRISNRLRQALSGFDRRMRGYLTDEAVLIGVESRTSSPVRVPRDPETLESPSVEGLYPAGEGAGYAGGIVSAAVDGMRVARSILQKRVAMRCSTPMNA